MRWIILFQGLVISGFLYRWKKSAGIFGVLLSLGSFVLFGNPESSAPTVIEIEKPRAPDSELNTFPGRIYPGGEAIYDDAVFYHRERFDVAQTCASAQERGA